MVCKCLWNKITTSHCSIFIISLFILSWRCVFVSMCVDAPLSGQGHRVSAAFEGAAAELQESEVKLAVVNVAEEKDLAKDLNATSPPTIRLYLAGDKHNPILCPGACGWQVVYPLPIHTCRSFTVFLTAGNAVIVIWFQTAQMLSSYSKVWSCSQAFSWFKNNWANRSLIKHTAVRVSS